MLITTRAAARSLRRRITARQAPGSSPPASVVGQQRGYRPMCSCCPSPRSPHFGIDHDTGCRPAPRARAESQSVPVEDGHQLAPALQFHPQCADVRGELTHGVQRPVAVAGAPQQQGHALIDTVPGRLLHLFDQPQVHRKRVGRPRRAREVGELLPLPFAGVTGRLPPGGGLCRVGRSRGGLPVPRRDKAPSSSPRGISLDAEMPPRVFCIRAVRIPARALAAYHRVRTAPS